MLLPFRFMAPKNLQDMAFPAFQGTWKFSLFVAREKNGTNLLSKVEIENLIIGQPFHVSTSNFFPAIKHYIFNSCSSGLDCKCVKYLHKFNIFLKTCKPVKQIKPGMPIMYWRRLLFHAYPDRLISISQFPNFTHYFLNLNISKWNKYVQ